MRTAGWLGLALAAGVAHGQTTVFRSDARLVEVHATVVDARGNYVDGLAREQFDVFDGGKPQPIVTFEPDTGELALAMLIDTTGSMETALGSVKNAVSRLIGELRPQDTVAVYGFSHTLERLQEFTRDKAAARRAVLRTRASGQTALFDAIAQVSQEISRRRGKRAIVLFTDGSDNASLLYPEAAIRRARKAGVPVYTIAEGDALTSPKLKKQLATIAASTGGLSYEAKKLADIGKVFEDILAELKHVYLMSYRPPAATASEWRPIRVAVRLPGEHTVRAKEGYFPE